MSLQDPSKKVKLDNGEDPGKTFAASSSSTKSQKQPMAAVFEGDDLWDSQWKEASGEKTLRTRYTAGDDGDDDVQFVLYSSWCCPFAQRAWIAAEASGVNYRIQEINPYYVDPQKPGGYTKLAMKLEEKKEMHPDFVEASPRGLVPAIRVPRSSTYISHHTSKQDLVLWESLPVAEYIDAVFGGGRLLARNDPYQRARQQIWCDHCTDRVQKKFYQALVAQDNNVQEQFVQEFYNECRSLARAMSEEGPFFDGKNLSLVDVALAPFWQRILTVGPHYFGLVLPMDEVEFQRLDIWWQACQGHPAVAATIVCEARLVSTYSDYSTNTATSDAARNYFK
jgi:glutathione S-transferase